MEGDIGGWLWLFIDVVLVLLLAVGLAYGTLRWREQQGRQMPQEERRREDAVKELYRASREPAIVRLRRSSWP